VFRAIQKLGWRVKKEKSGSHVQMVHDLYPEATWAFHDDVEIGPKMMARLAKAFHFTPEDL
jgi:predicted RNA binding protein YcfA (HicA-like mRNA interferase family)